jgi:2-C-methyl-D-erythritol 4-phosphate cytidylyltransferase
VPVAGRPMIEWSIDAFAACGRVGSIVVAAPPGEAEGSAAILGEVVRSGEGGRGREPGGTAGGAALEVVAGGATRAESVANALAAVETPLVAIHDAARPLLTPELVVALIAALEASPKAAGVIAAAPVTDTIKRAEGASAASTSLSGANADLVISGTEDRTELWAAQTPQVFRTEALREALAAAERPQKATDEAMLVEQAGGTVLIHPVEGPNLKVTTPLDLRFAELLLADRAAG